LDKKETAGDHEAESPENIDNADISDYGTDNP
jgi:hypothetical protein